MIENPLKSLRIKNHYSYLLVLGGIILLLSLFYETQVIPQLKLTILCLITIFYGLIEWIREFQFNNKIKQLNLDWDCFWDAQPMKGLAELNDPSYNSKLMKKFREEYKVERLMPIYHLKTWIIFILYLILMVLTYLK